MSVDQVVDLLEALRGVNASVCFGYLAYSTYCTPSDVQVMAIVAREYYD